MKAFIRERIAAGDTESEIKAQLVDQFGPTVLAVPPRKGFDWIAWLLPLAGLAVGAVLNGVLAWRWSRRRGEVASATGTSRSTPSSSTGWTPSSPLRVQRAALRLTPARRRQFPPRVPSSRQRGELAPSHSPKRIGHGAANERDGGDRFPSARACLVPRPSRAPAGARLPLGRLVGRGGASGGARRGAPGGRRQPPFVAGLVSVFVLLGAGAAAIGLSITRNQFLLEQVAGFVLIVFGLVFMGLLPWPERLVGAGLVQGARRRGSGFLLGGARCLRRALHRARPRLDPRPRRRLDTVLEARCCSPSTRSGWPCPFLVAAALFAPAMGLFRRVRDHYVAIQMVSGVILVALGALLFAGEFWRLRVYLNRFFEAIGLG